MDKHEESPDARADHAQPQAAQRGPSPQRGLLFMAVVWAVVMGVVYLLMQRTLAPKYPTAQANGSLEITRSIDGHFRTIGTVNGHETVFLIDTGASTVAVSDEFAAQAALYGGTPTVFQTANGQRTGRRVSGITVSVGPLEVRNAEIGIGISAGEDHEALLGQSFLRHFNVSMAGTKLVLSPRP